MNRFRPLVIALAVALALPACAGTDGAELVTEEGAAAVQEALDNATEEPTAELQIHNARSRMSPRMAGVAAVYLDIENPVATDDVLVSASVPAHVAASVELHETYEIEEDADDMAGDGHMGADDAAGDGHMGADDAAGDGHMAGEGHAGGAPMMGMREIPSIAIPAGSTVELVPGGLHIMLVDVVEELVPGDTYELTLEFERAGAVTILVEVREHV